MSKLIGQLIINSPYEEPKEHWKYDLNTQTFTREPGRRSAGYIEATPEANQYNDPGIFKEIPLVNEIRKRVKAWRENNYPGITGVTRKLIEHWNTADLRDNPFFFCQLDAMETLIWLAEAPEPEKTGIDIQGDGGEFKRICTKLCTGGGKTTVMAMLIAWQICNKAAYPQDKRFSKHIFIVAPGLTVKNRLQVLLVGGDNYYHRFNIVPPALRDKLRQGKVVINNWQALAWDSAEVLAKKKSVDKRGPKSNEAYARDVLGPLNRAQNILVINDEAHHAWRRNPENKEKLSKEDKEAEKEATIWVSGLDRIHAARSILVCYDFSATPFAPSGKKNDSEALFTWIVSDFSLNDGIESGLVKTPRIVIRDDNTPAAKTFRSRLYHIYADKEVKDNINQANAEPSAPLPDLVVQAYNLLGEDWLAAYKAWKVRKSPIPPVMITVANRTETAARIKYSFEHNRFTTEELCNPDYLIHIDSKTLEKAEAESVDRAGLSDLAGPPIEDMDNDEAGRKFSKKEQAAILR